MARITVRDIQKHKTKRQRFAMLTCYDYWMSRLLDDAGIELLLVGDSLGMVMLGHETTLPVTMEDVIHHTKAVARGARRSMVVADMPFLSYQASVETAMINAGRLIKEGGAEAVKLEGGRSMADRIAAIVGMGVPVMGHLGLTPQSLHQI
ncbi:MAG: 3-methyl-2-oxobutanoate hydroxymethyltransferase, partial [Candidatus Xenobia bacterium]